MGGFDSGRREYATTPTVGQSTSLCSDNVSEFTESPGLEGKVWWGEKEDADMQMFVGSEGESDTAEGRAARLRLVYHTEDAHTGDVIDEYDYLVPLDYTECNFGGYRPWFRCPDCSERVGKLHMPPGGYRFACRSCHGLGYASSRQSGQPVHRAIQRYKNAFEKADAEGRRPHPNNDPYLPDRPKNMHRETFQRLSGEVEKRRDEFHEAMDKRMRDMVKRLQAGSG